MKRKNHTHTQMLREIDSLRQRLADKDTQINSMRQQVNQTWRQVGNMSGMTAAGIKARLLEEAERARAEAEQHTQELELARRHLKTANYALEQRNAQLETAAHVAREATGILDAHKLLETTVRLISGRFGYYHAAIYLLDENGKYAILRAASSESGDKLIQRGYKLLVGIQGMVGRVAQTGEPSFYTAENSPTPSPTSPDILAPRSETALALKVRDRVIGVLDVRSTDAAAFTEQAVAILQVLADQVAVALDNARLFEQIKGHSRQLLTAAKVSKSAMTLLDPEKLMQHVVNLIRTSFDLHYVGIFLVDDIGKYAVLRAGSGKTVPPPQLTHHRFSVGSDCMVGRSITQAQALLIAHPPPALPNVGPPHPHSLTRTIKATPIPEKTITPDHVELIAPKDDAAYQEQTTLPDTRTEMILPLISRGRAIGALTVQSTAENAFNDIDVPVFQTMADQIATTLDNARLFTQTNHARTAAKQALKTAQETQRAAEAANKAKSAFLANMSHELRTPLNAILGFTQLMTRDATITTEQRSNLETINRSGTHLLTLINDILEMSKIEAGQTVLTAQNFDLHQLLAEVETLFRLRADDRNLTLEVSHTPEVPHYVCADENKLRQVLINLMGNAVKFTESGSVTLRTRARPDSDIRYSLITFELEDTGMGIGKDEVNHIFDPFVQTESGQTFTEGTGLGLPISRQFVRLMGGDITVESEVGNGSRFCFDVRVLVAEASDVRPTQVTREVLALAPGQHTPDGGTFRLLVVEDREANRRLLIKLLSTLGEPPQGFDIREATNGAEALEIWAAWHPHLIWMDMRMPVMDGYEATRRIKATEQGQHTLIIALTASAFEEDRVEILEEGCDDFVRKPFHHNEIFDKLAQHLGVRYIYEEETPPTEARPSKASTQAWLTVTALRALPLDLRAALEKAAIETDMQGVGKLITNIRAHNTDLANALQSLADDFEYGKILKVVQPANADLSP